MVASRIIIAGVAVAAAGGAGYIAKNMAAPPAPVEITQGPVAPSIATSEILVLSGDVPMGATIDGNVSWQDWPSDAINEHMVTKDREPDALEKLQGSVARLAMYQGEPLRRSKLIDAGQPFMSSILPSGKRAIATQIAADTSAGGFILPNDFVDVIMVRRGEGQGTTSFQTETILKNIRVLAIDQAIQEDEEGRKVKVGETATLELTPQQAEIISVAQQMADRLTLALRSVTDTQEVVTDEADYLVGGSGRRGTVRLIKSGVVSEEGARK